MVGFVYDYDPSRPAGGDHRQAEAGAEAGVDAGAGADGAGAGTGVVIGEVYDCFQPAAAAVAAAAAGDESEHALKEHALKGHPQPSFEAECVVCLNAGELCGQLSSNEALRWFSLGRVWFGSNGYTSFWVANRDG